MKRLWVAALPMLLAVRLQAQDDVETRAMRDEMKRTMQELHLPGAPGPYFVSYKIVDTERKDAQATLGALTSSSETQSRTLTVIVRVGNYQADSSGYASMNLSLAVLIGELVGGNAQLPLDDNYEELRRGIWLATDSAYKRAVEDLAGKKAALEKKNRTETIDDFSKEPARQESDLAPPVDVKLGDAERLVRSASAEFLKLKAVETSDAFFEATNTTEHFLNSEGTLYVRKQPEVYFHAQASLQRESGQTLMDSVAEFGRTMQDLPSETALTQEAAQVVAQLNGLEQARSAKAYNGPVLFEGVAAAEFFSSHFANLLAAKPAGIVDGSSALSSLFRGSTASLLSKRGSRVLPEFLQVVDNPQLNTAAGKTLFGGYKFDEEGVPAQETVLVKDGVLKMLLTSRTPVRGIDHSTGSMRERGVSPSNLFLTATKTSTLTEMKQQMLDLVKTRGLEYGMIVRRLSGGNRAIEAYRLFADGHEERVRNARITDTTVNMFKDILAASDQPTVYTVRGSGSSPLSGSMFARGDLVTYVVPALLFEDVSVEHSSNNATKSPVIPSPL